MKIFILYVTDQWCSKSSFERIGILPALDQAIKKAVEDAKEHSYIGKSDNTEDFEWALEERYQTTIKDVGYYIEEEEVSGAIAEETVDTMCDLIIDETHNPYGDIIWFQRQELSKEELYQYAEQMREKLENIWPIAMDLKEGKCYE